MDHTPQNVIHGESVVPPAKKKKISVTFFNTANNKVTKTFLEPDNWIEQLDGEFIGLIISIIIKHIFY